MTSSNKDAPDCAGFFFDLPGLHLYALDENLEIRWRHPDAASSREDEILGAVREIISSTEGREAVRSAGAPPLVRTVRLDAGGGLTETVLVTIEARPIGTGGAPAYRTLVQNIGGSALDASAATAPEGGGLTAQDLRKFLHTLSNPLSVISGFAEILLSSQPEGTPNRECVEEIFSNALRMRRIIDEASSVKNGAPRSDAPGVKSTR